MSENMLFLEKKKGPEFKLDGGQRKGKERGEVANVDSSISKHLLCCKAANDDDEIYEEARRQYRPYQLQ